MAYFKAEERTFKPYTDMAQSLSISRMCDGGLKAGERKEVNDTGRLNKFSKHRLSP